MFAYFIDKFLASANTEDDFTFALLRLLVHFLKAGDARRVVFATLVVVGYFLGHDHLRIDIILLELVEQGERLGFIRVQVLDDAQSSLELCNP